MAVRCRPIGILAFSPPSAAEITASAIIRSSAEIRAVRMHPTVIRIATRITIGITTAVPATHSGITTTSDTSTIGPVVSP